MEVAHPVRLKQILVFNTFCDISIDTNSNIYATSTLVPAYSDSHSRPRTPCRPTFRYPSTRDTNHLSDPSHLRDAFSVSATTPPSRPSPNSISERIVPQPTPHPSSLTPILSHVVLLDQCCGITLIRSKVLLSRDLASCVLRTNFLDNQHASCIRKALNETEHRGY